MANTLITNRINILDKKRKELLKMKKVQRYGQLKVVNDTISRLKRWNLTI